MFTGYNHVFFFDPSIYGKPTSVHNLFYFVWSLVGHPVCSVGSCVFWANVLATCMYFECRRWGCCDERFDSRLGASFDSLVVCLGLYGNWPTRVVCAAIQKNQINKGVTISQLCYTNL